MQFLMTRIGKIGPLILLRRGEARPSGQKSENEPDARRAPRLLCLPRHHLTFSKSFSPPSKKLPRVAEVAERFGLNSRDVLCNIVVSRAQNTDQQTTLLGEAAGLMSEVRFSLLVVDSVTNLYRSEFTGRGEGGDFVMRVVKLKKFNMTLHHPPSRYLKKNISYSKNETRYPGRSSAASVPFSAYDSETG